VAPQQNVRVSKTLKSFVDETLVTNHEKLVAMFALLSLIRGTRKRNSKAGRPPLSACLPSVLCSLFVILLRIDADLWLCFSVYSVLVLISVLHWLI
jgi:hypothetical protein